MRTTHLPTLQVPDLGRNHTHLQHIPPKPEPHRTPDWVPEDAPYTSHDRAYHYPNTIQHLARVLGDTDSRAHIQELPGETASPPLPLGTAPSKRPSPPPETTHPAPQGATTIPHQGCTMARPEGTSTSRRNTAAARATTPPQRIGSTSRNAPSIRAGTHKWAGPRQKPYGNTKAGQPTAKHTRPPNTSSEIPWSRKPP